MNIDKIKEILKNKKIVSIAGLSIVAIIGLTMSGYMMIHNKNKVEANNQVATVKKEKDNSEEKEVQEKLEELKKIDTSKLSEEDKKSIEETKKLIEDMINTKEYDKAKRAIDSVKTNIDNKFNEIAKNEEEKVNEESKEEVKEENKEVASNTTENSTSSSTVNTGSSNSSNTSSNSSSSSSSSQGTVQQPTTPVVEEKPVQSTPTPEPTPQQPVVETPTPVYPSVAEVQQRLIVYGQSLGLTYDSSLAGNGFELQGTDQMWDSEMGNSGVCRRLLDGTKAQGYTRFAVVVKDLGNGFCSMGVYVSYDE